MRTSCICVVWFLGVFYFTPVRGQNITDSFTNAQVSSLRNIYFEQLKGNASLYEGSNYVVPGGAADGFPFFQADVIRQGTITVRGIKYAPVSLYYDLTTDAVITYNFLHDDLMTLDADKIDSFSIGAHIFVHLPMSDGLAKKGFFEQLYTGDPGLYVRREKKFYYGTGNQQSRYSEKNDYYVRYKNVFYKTNSKADMLSLFHDQEDALKKYIHSYKINFKEEYETALLRCVIFYGGLKH